MGNAAASMLDCLPRQEFQGMPAALCSMFGKRVSLQHDSRVLVGSVSNVFASHVSRSPAAREPGLTAEQLQTGKPCRCCNVRLAKQQSFGPAMSRISKHGSTADGQTAGMPAQKLQAAMLMAKIVCSTAQLEVMGELHRHEYPVGLPGRDKSGPGLHAPVVLFSNPPGSSCQSPLCLGEAPECLW